MSLSVIDRYVAKKQKDLLDYAKILESIITIDNNKMWKKKNEFSIFAKDIIKIYADGYYFENNMHRDNPIEYSNDNINNVLKSIIEYCKTNNKASMLKEWKNEIFLMSVIICTACYVDFATNIVDGDFNDTKGKFKYLLKYLGKTKILNISDNKYWINDLFDAIKKSNIEDEKAFEYIKSDDYKNEYIIVSNNPLYQKIKFTYSIPSLDAYDDALSKSVLKTYEDKLKEISYELLDFQILKDLISNNEMGIYLVDICKTLKKPSVLKLFDSKYIKPFIKILVPWNESVNYQNIIRDYTNQKIDIIYEYDEVANINSKIFLEETNLLVNQEFLDNNLDNQLEFEKKKIKFVVKNKED